MSAEKSPQTAAPALRSGDAFFATLCQSAPIAIVQSDEKGRITYLNPAWQVLTGRSAAEGVGLGWIDAIHPDDRDWILADWQIAVADAAAITRQFRLVQQDGREIDVRMVASPVISPDGKFVGHIGTFENISDQQQLEKRLSSQSERFIADRRKDRFLDELAHELRNPVAAISMACETLSRLCGDAPDMRTMIDVIARQSLHASQLLNDVLDISRLAHGRIQLRCQRINVLEQLRAALDDRRAQLDAHRMRLHLELPRQPLWVSADPKRLFQVFGNLIDNAIKFTPPGGELTASARRSDDKRRACVEVRDTGIGIEPQALSKIFEPFSQGDRRPDSRRGGMGLGLALAKGIVELHGGAVQAESEGPGRGACFRISLPLADPAADNDANSALPSGARRSLRILIIEDSADVVASLDFLLRHSGHELSSAPDGREGIETARRIKPDVILCDIGLPDMEGYDVARQLRADPATRSVYLIAVSGFGSEEDRQRSHEAGFDLHLNKPEGFVGLNELLLTLPIAK